MQGILDVKSPNFLGGNNVHHVVIIGLLLYVTYKVSKK
jgi:hypothetical protein